MYKRIILAQETEQRDIVISGSDEVINKRTIFKCYSRYVLPYFLKIFLFCMMLVWRIRLINTFKLNYLHNIYSQTFHNTNRNICFPLFYIFLNFPVDATKKCKYYAAIVTLSTREIIATQFCLQRKISIETVYWLLLN